MVVAGIWTTCEIKNVPDRSRPPRQEPGPCTPLPLGRRRNAGAGEYRETGASVGLLQKKKTRKMKFKKHTEHTEHLKNTQNCTTTKNILRHEGEEEEEGYLKDFHLKVSGVGLNTKEGI